MAECPCCVHSKDIVAYVRQDPNMMSFPSNSHNRRRCWHRMPSKWTAGGSSRNPFSTTLAFALKTVCSRVQDACDTIQSVHRGGPLRSNLDHVSMKSQNYGNYRQVWRRALGSIRHLVGHRPPSSLGEVFDILAISFAVWLSGNPCHYVELSEFVNDLDRWRLFVPESEEDAFDQIAKALWNYTPGEPTKEPGDLLIAFEELVGKFVPRGRERRTSGGSNYQPGSSGNLSDIQSRFEGSDSVGGSSNRHGAHGGNMAGTHIEEPPDPPPIPDDVLTSDGDYGTARGGEQSDPVDDCEPVVEFDTDFEDGDEMDDSDGLPSKTETSSQLPKFSFSPATVAVYLLASVAIAIVIAVILGLRMGNTAEREELVSTLKRQPSPLSQSYLLFHILVRLSSVPVAASAVSALWANSSSVKENDEGLAPAEESSTRTSTPNNPSPVATNSPKAERSASADTGPAIENGAARAGRMECAFCSKSFSNVGNLRRHQRGDCREVRGSQPSFRCGNLGCENEFTRKAYREKHKRERCRFRHLV
ncbi:hypothetical protein B0T24DRAFT_626718 [Lasiosphaeria ovina]|uniref:C2H2-type domain-containing protein n=1 Tax=Lasiosphaeria ovina TaxID=92902 RepID=A0AAE0KE41_9PEZI|nr:hypothetical protein B0T24DRAFT_626718 [Lasiosphaeria ovina]